MTTPSSPGVRPRVSVALITYQQEQTLPQAVESVLAQVTSFDVEIVIGEDASTDRTRQLAIDYARRFPSRIRLVLQATNRGLLKNFRDTFTSCRGEYVALLDGDDYWLSVDKLERQVEFLDAHPECTICCHGASMLRTGEITAADRYPEPSWKPIATMADLLEENFIPTCSAMLRRDAVADLPDWFESCPWEDWPLFLLYAEQGAIGYLADVLGVYRVHASGLWSGLPAAEQIRRKIAFMTDMDVHLGRRYHDQICARVARYQVQLDGLLSPHGAPSGTAPQQGPAHGIACRGDYASWADALAASTGHYLPEFVEKTRQAVLKVKQGEAVYERDSVLFNKVEHSFPLLVGLMRAALEFNGSLTVFDFGGGFGTSYFQCRPMLAPVRSLRWLIVDQPSHVEHGKRDFESEELHFVFSPQEVFAGYQPHVLLLSGVLPCVPAPYELLKALLPHAVPYLIVDRTFFLERDADRLTVQHGPFEIYPGSYPAWFLSESRLVAMISSAGYELLADFDGFDSVGPEDERAYTKGFLFRYSRR